ncbi:MAG: hypothetical protein ACQCN5_07630 [Candidatus Bathyarchaeia archaeon]
MNLKLKPVITTRQVALIVVFSAIYAAMRIIPTFPVIGVEGASFSLADILAPIYGIILGPYLGGASVIIGTFIGMSMKAPVFLGLDFLPALVNTVAIGFLARRKWLPAVILYIALLSAFTLNPLTLNFVSLPIGSTTLMWPFTWMHLVAFIVLLSPLGMKAGKWIQSVTPQNTAVMSSKSGFKRFISQLSSKAVVGFAVLMFIGTMLQHLMGNILYENIFVYVNHYLTPEALMLKWNIVFFLFPWERTILVIFAVLVGLPLFYALVKTQLIKITNPAVLEKKEKVPA